jgi:hypothetical protein
MEANMIPYVVVAVVLVALLWFAAGLMCGLWLGERGRRTDLQWFVGLQQPAAAQDPEPKIERIPTEDELAILEAETQALAATLYEEATAAGKPVSEEAAREEAERMIQELHGVG